MRIALLALLVAGCGDSSSMADMGTDDTMMNGSTP
jgi:hypothetical protein